MRERSMAKSMETTRTGLGASARRAAVVIAVLVAITTTVFTPAATAQGEAGNWLSQVNSLRASRGVAPLQVDGNLTGLAQSWADHLAAQGALSHASNLGAGVTSNWSKLGENVGMGGDVGSIMNAFVNSPAHYANLVDPAFTHIGIGVSYSGGFQFVAHRFMAIAGGAPATRAGPGAAARPRSECSPPPIGPIDDRSPHPSPLDPRDPGGAGRDPAARRARPSGRGARRLAGGRRLTGHAPAAATPHLRP